MNKRILAFFSPKLGLVLAAFITAVLVIAPQMRDEAKADLVNCQVLTNSAAFNIYPVSTTVPRPDCTDRPVIAAYNNGYFGNVNAQVGDVIEIRSYIHNGAQDGGPAALNTNVNISVDTNPGTSHTLSANFHSDTAGSKSGSMSINTPDGASLEIVPGSEQILDYYGSPDYGSGSVQASGSGVNAHFDSILACFQYSKFVVFQVRVTGGQVQPPAQPSAEISAQLGSRISGQCLWYGSVNWTTANVPNVRVYVRDNSGQEKLMAAEESANKTVDWIEPGNFYTFILRGDNIPDRTATINASNLTCAEQPPVQPTATISAQLGAKINGVCLWTGTVTWTTSNVPNVRVYVKDRSGVETLMAAEESATKVVDWIEPGNIYTFILRGDNINQQTAVINASGLTCEVPTQTFTATATATATASAQASCPDGTTATATATATASASATSNISQADAQNKAQAQAQTNAQAQAQAQAQASVKCPAAPPAQISCQALNSPVASGATANFSVTNGTAPFTWQAATGNPASQTLYTTFFSTVFTNTSASPVTKTVTVTDSLGRSATCQAVVNGVQAPPPALTCQATVGAVNVNQPVTFTASGGTGAYSWTSIGNPPTGNAMTYVTSFANPGTQTAAVTSGSQTAHCSVLVNQPQVPVGTILLNKEVRNVTQGGSFAGTVSAKTGDVVEYRISVSSATSLVLTNVKVTDTFASGLTFVSGSLNASSAFTGSSLETGGLTFAQVSQTPLVITYRATVTATSGSIVNTAQATASNATNVAYDQAMVTVAFVPAGQPALTITKQASVSTAKKGDTVSYQIVVKNVGQAAATNVFISDNIHSSYFPLQNVSISRTTGGTWPAGISLTSLGVNESVTITYAITVKDDGGSIINTATVSASNAATAQATAIVNITTTVNPGNTIINNTNTNINTCVNNSCNTYIITTTGNVVPINEAGQLSVSKSVRNANTGTFGNSVTANNGDIVEFEVIVSNTGNQVVNNVRLNDTWSGGLNYISGSTRVDGAQSGDMWSNNTLNLGSLYTGQQKRITFQAQVAAAAGASIQNIARATGDNVPAVQDDAWVFVSGVQGGNVSLTYSKKAWNDNKNVDATAVPASKEDFITYTLTVTNNGNTPANNFVITDDLSGILPYADMVDNGGGTVSGNVITYPGLTIPAGGSVSKSFRVRVKFFLADNLNYVMKNTYGNTVIVNINTPQVKGVFIAPKTGSNSMALAFSAMLTAGFGLIKKRKYLLELIFT